MTVMKKIFLLSVLCLLAGTLTNLSAQTTYGSYPSSPNPFGNFQSADDYYNANLGGGPNRSGIVGPSDVGDPDPGSENPFGPDPYNPDTPEDPGATPLGKIPFLFFGVLITGYLVTKKCSFAQLRGVFTRILSSLNHFGRILARSFASLFRRS